jgi:hypothetical protein
MKISLNWLKELCPTSLSATEVAARLTAAGLEIEGREERGLPVQTPAPGAPAGVVAAKVLVRAPIAGSDHLSLCDVDDGTQVWKVSAAPTTTQPATWCRSRASARCCPAGC